MTTKKKQPTQPSKIGQWITETLALQGEVPAPIDCGGLMLVNATKSPYALDELICDERFGSRLGGALRSLIVEPFIADRAMPDHELRLVHTDGFGYALYSFARLGKCKLVILAFQRGPVAFTEADKQKMFSALSIAERLVHKPLN